MQAGSATIRNPIARARFVALVSIYVASIVPAGAFPDTVTPPNCPTRNKKTVFLGDTIPQSSKGLFRFSRDSIEPIESLDRASVILRIRISTLKNGLAHYDHKTDRSESEYAIADVIETIRGDFHESQVILTNVPDQCVANFRLGETGVVAGLIHKYQYNPIPLFEPYATMQIDPSKSPVWWER